MDVNGNWTPSVVPAVDDDLVSVSGSGEGRHTQHKVASEVVVEPVRNKEVVVVVSTVTGIEQQYQRRDTVGTLESMTKDEPDSDLPSQDQAKQFYATYEPKDILGKGLSSTVRRVVEKATGKQYAVKIIDISGERDSQANCDTLKADTIREVNVLRMCAGHPNIIELHDFFESPTFLFLVFELCKEGELFDYLTREVSLSEKRTRFFMRQLFQVVNYLHSKGVVHRDLKPENILLDDNMSIKVSDFGFATVLSEGEHLTELLGTPGYLAPEVLHQAMDEDHEGGYGLEVDLWACGVIMFTLLCGSPPFWHRKQMYMLRDIMAGNYSFSSPLWSDVTDIPKDLITKLLVTEPSRRLTAKQALEHPFFQRDEKDVQRKIPTLKFILSSKADLESLLPQRVTAALGLQTVSKRQIPGYRSPAPTPPRSLSVGLPGLESVPVRVFKPRRMFRAAVFSVQFFFRLKIFHLRPPPVSVETVLDCPYTVKQFRRLIDGCAFSMYAHWVKRGENQNRAALFEHTMRDDWKLLEA